MTPRLTVWPPLPLGAYVARAPADPPFPLQDPGHRLYARARHGLALGVAALGLGCGDRVLVPAYHHGSEVEALVRAGLEPVFYPCDEDLRPAAEPLDELLGPRVKVLHLTHYLGFGQDAAHYRQWADERGVLLIEDAAQAFLGLASDRPAGAWGDLAVTCVYKTLGVPDGAAVVCREPLPPTPGTVPFGVAGGLRRHWASIAQRRGAPRWLAAHLAKRRYDPTRDMAVGGLGSSASRLTRRLLPRLAHEGVAATRRSNYEALLVTLCEAVPRPFRTLPPGACPMAFPVSVPHKARALQALDDAGITGLDLWSVAHPALPDIGFDVERELRAHVVGLPVHQELRPEHLRQIARAAARAIAA